MASIMHITAWIFWEFLHGFIQNIFDHVIGVNPRIWVFVLQKQIWKKGLIFIYVVYWMVKTGCWTSMDPEHSLRPQGSIDRQFGIDESVKLFTN